ncbi:hypothetical protein D8Y22_18010 [Salinadaptatus halalkaliphilus]|uniref:Uncharacterized protein n=1 Tax=Salinadaptatus halalkaliphilus TaxID=2419781 RepID=A0A4S3TI34_9EURY|nr:hypothetical protein [Salinadaptatus halalkaliphilus]THE63704.1 hypothetical protein D8Y22_18010 [Salinadaptatus halalkaliphilus]
MFPPFAAPESITTDDVNPHTSAYRDVVIYDAADAEEPLYEDPIVAHANGWIELEGNRLLSPQAIHHIDIYDERLEDDGAARSRSDRNRSDDGNRTNRFSLR